jgi:hypothetical protein
VHVQPLFTHFSNRVGHKPQGYAEELSYAHRVSTAPLRQLAHHLE